MRVLMCSVFVAGLILSVFSGAAEARGGRSYGNQGGHYAGGSGSSHKGGTYRNARTRDHYTRH